MFGRKKPEEPEHKPVTRQNGPAQNGPAQNGPAQNDPARGRPGAAGQGATRARSGAPDEAGTASEARSDAVPQTDAQPAGVTDASGHTAPPVARGAKAAGPSGASGTAGATAPSAEDGERPQPVPDAPTGRRYAPAAGAGREEGTRRGHAPAAVQHAATGQRRGGQGSATGPDSDPDAARTAPPASGVGPGSVPPLERTLRPGASVDLTTVLGPLSIPNPVMTASGCAANGAELHRLFDIATLGAFVTKTVLASPRSGRGTPRMAETASGMLNSIGLQGPGIEAFVERDLPWLMSAGARVIVSIAGNEPREFASVAKTLVQSPAFDACVGVEVNISCPNVANRGLVFACDPAATTEVIDRVRTQVPPGIPILVKLSPDVTDIVAIARAAVHAGADGLTMINTLLGLEIDTGTMRPAMAGITGGLSGPAIRPVALRAIWQVYAAMRAGVVPTRSIVGVGGIRTGRDALGFLAAGATAVQVGTAIFNDPHAPVRVRDGLAEELRVRGLASPGDAVGIAHTRVPQPRP